MVQMHLLNRVCELAAVVILTMIVTLAMACSWLASSYLLAFQFQ